MAKRDPLLEYMDIQGPNGSKIETMTVKLYAPEGHIFAMPHGGSALRYVAKGYEIHSTPEWEEKHKEYLKIQADSLRLSKLQGEIKNRKKAIEAQEKLNDDYAELEKLDVELKAKEDTLNGVEPVKVAEKPKAKAKAKA